MKRKIIPNPMQTHYFPLYFFFLIIFLSTQSLAQSNGTIPVGSSITATRNSSIWLSSSAEFAFGFQFIQQNGLFLLSIWYNKINEQTIVWYPIQGNLVPSGSKVELDAQLGLVLTDPKGDRVWSSHNEITTTTIDHGFINDTGNFVLRGPDSLSLWETFENPSDTLLPTQTMEINGVLNSRISYTNFSQGRFQFRLLENGNAVLNPRNVQSNVSYGQYYSTNTNDNLNSSNSGRQVVFEETGHLFIVRQSGIRFDLTDSLPTGSRDYYFRATLHFDGVFVIYRHPKSSDTEQNWTAIWSEPENICSAIVNDMGTGACGYNSICELDTENTRPKCECPQGYSLLDPNDKYGSCKQDFVESCDEKGQSVGEDRYDFVVLDDTNWPLNDYDLSIINEEGCRNSCLNDCFCAVVVHNNANQCWKKRLPLSNGRRVPSFGDVDTKTLVKINKGNSSKENPDSLDQIPCTGRKQGVLILVVSILLGSSIFINFVFLGVGLFGFFHIYKRKFAKPISGKNVVETNLQAFSYEELFQATNGFAEELGRGAFGIVYKGTIEIGGSRGIVAVKKLNKLAQDTEKEFRTEVNVIGRTHHKNLVRLVGFCEDGDNRLLVYEYMSNGTIASFLFSATKPSWNLRTQIALGIARGLLYLHDECSTQIIHCDIKPQNILVDEYYNGRISDFGLAKLLMINQTQTNTAIRGTRGYVAPEWFRNNPVTVKVDVYSFGVMLLEILTCRRSVEGLNDGSGGGVREILTDWVWDCFDQGTLEALVQNDIEALNDMKAVERVALVGIWCIQEDPNLRPSMRKVSQMLEGVVQVTRPPCPWPFYSITMQ